MILIVLLSVLIVGLYALNKWIYSYWKRRGVPGPDPLPLVGNLLDTMLLRKTLGANIHEYYRKFKNVPYFGIYKSLTPMLVIRDTTLIKKIFTTDFEYFHDNAIALHADEDCPLSKNPFGLKGNQWKVMRGQITPALTSGKIRSVYPLILEVCDEFLNYLSKGKTATEGVEAKETCGKFTMDVVASCAFGLKAESLTNPNAVFRQMGNKIFSSTKWNAIKMLIIRLFPALTTILQPSFMPPEVSRWFKQVVADTIRYRKENKITRDDFLQSILQIQEKLTENGPSINNITGHSLTFLLDGFETSSYLIAFALYEIAGNPDVQEKLRNEVKEAVSHHDGNLTYDALIDMGYLECVLYETMRKHPVTSGFFRECTKEYTFPPVNGGSGPGLTVSPGAIVMVPLHSLHLDPQYFPKPHRFNPDRFRDEESKQRHKNAYYPFGEGPRMCLGLRFGMVQAKACVASVVLNMDIRVAKKMKEPIEIDPKSLLPAAKDGIWLTFHPRKNS